MAIRIETAEGHLDLQQGCLIEMDLRSPMWNDLGSQSAVVTLPPTARNRMLLGHPARMDMTARHDTVDGWLTDGAFRTAVKINVLSASDTGIEVSLGTDESLMYQSWQDTPLRDIPGLPLYAPQGEDETDRLDALIGMCEEIYQREADDSDFRVFPIALEFSGAGEDAADDTPRAVILNRLKSDVTVKRPGALFGTSLDSAERTIGIGTSTDETVLVPEGYGISPFLRVCRLLHILFGCYGYSLEENVFDTDPQLSNLVLLNNTMDAITRGMIDYRDLLPDCTVNDLLESLRTRFGAVFYIDGSSRTARCVLVRDSLSAEPDLDLTPLHQSRPSHRISTPRHLVLSDAGSYEQGTTETDTLDTFLDRYRDFIDIYGHAGSISPLMLDLFTQTVLRYDYSTLQFSFFSAMTFPWQPQSAASGEYALSSKDRSVPLYAYRGRANASDHPEIFNLAALPLYLSGVRNAHTALKVSSSLQTDETLDRETDLAFCFAHGRYMTPDGYDYGMNYGSPFCNAPDGSRFETPDGDTYRYSLTFTGEDGCYNRFWKAFDRILRHSDRTIETTLRLDRSRLSLLDLSRPKTLFGQLLLADTIQFTLPMDSSVSRTSTLRTMRPLDPTDTTADIVLSIGRPAGYWALTTDADTVRARLLRTIRTWLDSTYPDRYEITATKEYVHRTSVMGDLRLPTAEQLASHAVRRTGYTLTIKVEYDYYASSIGGPREHSWTEEFGSVTEIYEATAYE